MSRVLLDTSGYSAMVRGHALVAEEVRVATEIAVTPTVLGELYVGFAGGRHARRNGATLRAFLASPRVVLYPVDDETAERYAIIFRALRSAGTPIPINDVWIAASAMQHGHAVVTTDADFARIPQIVARCFDVVG